MALTFYKGSDLVKTIYKGSDIIVDSYKSNDVIIALNPILYFRTATGRIDDDPLSGYGDSIRDEVTANVASPYTGFSPTNVGARWSDATQQTGYNLSIGANDNTTYKEHTTSGSITSGSYDTSNFSAGFSAFFASISLDGSGAGLLGTSGETIGLGGYGMSLNYTGTAGSPANTYSGSIAGQPLVSGGGGSYSLTWAGVTFDGTTFNVYNSSTTPIATYTGSASNGSATNPWKINNLRGDTRQIATSFKESIYFNRGLTQNEVNQIAGYFDLHY